MIVILKFKKELNQIPNVSIILHNQAFLNTTVQPLLFPKRLTKNALNF
jgi:hypothetical protein